MKMDMEHRWNDGTGEQNYCENTLFYCHFVLNKSERPATIRLSSTTQAVAWCWPRNEPAQFNDFSRKAEIERRSNFANLRGVRPPLEIWHGIWTVNFMDTIF